MSKLFAYMAGGGGGLRGFKMYCQRGGGQNGKMGLVRDWTNSVPKWLNSTPKWLSSHHK